MVLGIDLPSLGSGINIMSILGGAFTFIVAIIMFIIVGVGLYLFLKWKNNKKIWNKKIFWFEEVNGSPIPTGEDNACELTIPNTSIKIFYIKTKKLYLPRLTIKMGKDAYWLFIRRNREIINFRMKNLNQDMKEMNLDYDHSDMRYANENIGEMVKRNYRDKSQPWWREYKEVISIGILIVLLTICSIFILSKIGSLINQVNSLIQHADTLVQSAKLVASQCSSSGVIGAG